MSYKKIKKSDLKTFSKALEALEEGMVVKRLNWVERGLVKQNDMICIINLNTEHKHNLPCSFDHDDVVAKDWIVLYDINRDSTPFYTAANILIFDRPDTVRIGDNLGADFEGRPVDAFEWLRDTPDYVILKKYKTK